MTKDEFCYRLKYLAMQRSSYYSNEYPFNCLYIHENGVLSADCTNLIKSLINNPEIYDKTSPAGYWVKPGQVIPDYSVREILNTCTGVSTNFKSIPVGSFLAMGANKHAGIYVGEFNDGGICNTVEATTDWGADKITTSYTDSSGKRYNHKGGTMAVSSWDAHGLLTKYIDYRDHIKWRKKWHLYVDGEMVKGKWYEVKGEWYLFDIYGIMLTGWQKRKGEWYYLDPKTGAMVTGEVWIGNKLYKFDTDGKLISS